MFLEVIMFNGYRKFGKGAVSDDYVFSKIEAMSVLLAKRKDVFELGFFVRPNSTREENAIKFVSDDEVLPVSEVEIMESPRDSFEHAARSLKYHLLLTNPTPTLGQMRQVNEKIIEIQTKNPKNCQEK